MKGGDTGRNTFDSSMVRPIELPLPSVQQQTLKVPQIPDTVLQVGKQQWQDGQRLFPGGLHSVGRETENKCTREYILQ